MQCRKHEPAPTNNLIVGNWNWVSTSGGLAGVYETPENTGKIIFVEFGPEGIFRMMIDGQMVRECKYTISNGANTEDAMQQVMYSDSTMSQTIYFKDLGYLILTDMVSDGFTYEYKRAQ